jgi:hypothetical protein
MQLVQVPRDSVCLHGKKAYQVSKSLLMERYLQTEKNQKRSFLEYDIQSSDTP